MLLVAAGQAVLASVAALALLVPLDAMDVFLYFFAAFLTMVLKLKSLFLINDLIIVQKLIDSICFKIKKSHLLP